MNQFQFEQGIYLIFFMLAGLISIVAGVFVWGLNRLLTRLRHPPHFHFSGLLYNMAFPAVFGAMLAGIPMFIAVYLVSVWFKAGSDGGTICGPMIDNELEPSPLCFERYTRLGG